MTTISVETGLAKSTQRPKHRNHTSPLGLFIAIIRRSKNTNEFEHKEAFKKQIMEPGFEPYLEKLIEEWQSIKYNTALSATNPQSLEDIQQDRKRRLEDEKNNRAQQKILKQNAKTIIGERLLSLITPKGIPLGDCTGAECKAFGGFYAMIAAKVGANQLVRQVLQPEQIALFAEKTSLPLEDS